jgi:hypothetical protein
LSEMNGVLTKVAKDILWLSEMIALHFAMFICWNQKMN